MLIEESKKVEVEKILDSIRPAMEADGGGVQLVSIAENVVYVRFKGACLVCPSVNLTLEYGITKPLQEKLNWISKVVIIE